MSNLIFKRVVILSDTQKSANQFKFNEKYNLITGGIDHSAGKSSLVKALLWAVGCTPHDIPSSWKELDCKILVECGIGDNNFTFYRYNNIIKFNINGGEYQKFTKITGEYSSEFSKIVGFSALLPQRPNNEDEPILETPPPAYYFLPFYIDQKKGWGEFWNSLDNLSQFPDWKRTIIKFHTGYFPPRHFELQQEIYNFRLDESLANKEVRRMCNALDVVEDHIPKSNFTLNENIFDSITENIKSTLNKLLAEQESTIEELSELVSENHNLESQLEILRVAAQELEQDYTFSVENISNDELECPLCGTEHNNSLINKAEILADKVELEKQARKIESESENLNRKINILNSTLEAVRKKTREINHRHSLNDVNGESVPLSDAIESLASNTIQRRVNLTKDEKSLEASKAKEGQNTLKKQQNKLLSKQEKNKRDEYFLESLTSNINDLSIPGVSLDEVHSPLNYKKLLSDGGAAESTRAVLAYHASTIKMIAEYGSEVLAPFIIDTPRQQEQNKSSYEKIVHFIMNNLPKNQQIFLCALDDPLLEDFRKNAKITKLNKEEKLLTPDKYETLRKEIEDVINY